MNWYSGTIQRIGDPDGLMVVEVKGNSLKEAKERLADVLRLQAVVINHDFEEV